MNATTVTVILPYRQYVRCTHGIELWLTAYEIDLNPVDCCLCGETL